MQKSQLGNRIKTPLELDASFNPIILGNKSYTVSLKDDGVKAEKVFVALTRTDGAVSVKEYLIHAEGEKYDGDTRKFLERQIKSLIWAYGGTTLYLSGPDIICKYLKAVFSINGTRQYDANRMQVIYDKEFEMHIVSENDIPEKNETELSIGGHLNGCRIGFDLGASDYKISSVIDGEPVYTAEIPWNPSIQTDPKYHYEHINSGLREAANHLPRVDAIGGSAAGAYINNEVKYASLFRSIPRDTFDSIVRPMFLNLKKEWGVPFDVLNDGEVTALAGALSLKKKALLGIAMGSSEASGFVNKNGLFTGNYNELSYVGIDYNEDSAVDPVSKDYGCGSQYFSQQAVNRLAIQAGFEFPEEMLLPERLKLIQKKVESGNQKAIEIFKTIGVYLGYTLPFYHELFDFQHVLILGRVTSGTGGELIIDYAKKILKEEFSAFSEKISIFVPDEKSRRVGQAVAAASLPITSESQVD